jgi:hypothetical protein
MTGECQPVAGETSLGFVREVPALGHAALKINSECSFTLRKLRFLADFCLACPSLGDSSDKP